MSVATMLPVGTNTAAGIMVTGVSHLPEAAEVTVTEAIMEVIAAGITEAATEAEVEGRRRRYRVTGADTSCRARGTT